MFIEVKNLVKKYKEKTVVDDVNISIDEGQFIALLGPNGAGKSTTINMITGLLSTTSGEIKIAGMKPNDKHFGHNIGVVFQQSTLDKELTVKENLKNRAAMYRNVQTIEDSLIEEFELKSILNQKYGSLSGGQKRRVDIARSLVHNPKALFLDEPSTGLDIQTRSVIWQTLDHFRKENGLTIILTTHYLEETENADFVYIIDHGKIIKADTVSNLKKNFARNILTLETKQKENVIELLNEYQDIKTDKNCLSIYVQEKEAVILVLNKVSDLIENFEYKKGTMDDIFVTLTGREIR
ncbi:ABC transporter ATP-binding protein [Lactobacillus sp. YT155]|uniref:ABC transporter ATP-binding protein n=1 Tax=Lactobacillus sp. YT155 TaxID=3060955 RepID=UPI00265F1FF8|nr:ABC transporter ATP-binding protein [Lactobacillus sp. YT155]MDO1605938.1 ABC transporter ATP-binding protein [Lactobacillus sp. YT155]